MVATLRENAEIEVKKDEKRMYELRDLMAKQCTGLGAMFDERTFDCVYTVNFFAGENQTYQLRHANVMPGIHLFVCKNGLV